MGGSTSRIHQHTAPKRGSASRIHQHTAPQKGVRLQNSSTKGDPPLEFINQRGSAFRFHQPKGDPPLDFLNQKGIASTKKGQFLWKLLYSFRCQKLKETQIYIVLSKFLFNILCLRPEEIISKHNLVQQPLHLKNKLVPPHRYILPQQSLQHFHFSYQMAYLIPHFV